MLIKSADDKTKRLALLEDLQKSHLVQGLHHECVLAKLLPNQ